MRRFLTILGAIVLCATAFAFNDQNGLAYGDDTGKSFDGHAVDYEYWAGVASGNLEFQGFLFYSGSIPQDRTYFTGSRLTSFMTYTDPFFGKVADFTMEGVLGDTPGYGRWTIGHFQVTDSAFPGKTFGYYAFNVYIPGYSQSIFTSVGINNDNSHILIGGDPGPAPHADSASTQGLAYGNFRKAITNRLESASSNYRVYYNYLQCFTYDDEHAFFKADRIRSFQCQNQGLFGKQADFWLDGRLSDSPSKSGMTTVAHVIVTDTAWCRDADLMYIAIYLPNYLNTPIYERIVFLRGSANNILCK